MSIDRNAAVDYFKDHVRSAVWNGFAEGPQSAAIAHAKRLLSRALNSNIDDETIDVYDYSYRPDYAVYEQALWILENGAIANGEQSAPGFVATDPSKPDNARDSQKAILSPEALRWLGVGPAVYLSRG